MERAINHISDDTGRIALLEVKTRIGGSEILPANQTKITRYQYSNHLGSACLELNESAEVLSYEEFHPFGSTSYSMHTNDSEVSLKRYKYNGKERDNESGLDFYGARYYANWLCRFVSVDPLKDNYSFQNSFAYAANNPITLTDVNGEGPGGGEEEEKVKPVEGEKAVSNGVGGKTLFLPNESKLFVYKGDNIHKEGNNKEVYAKKGEIGAFEINGVKYIAEFDDKKQFLGYKNSTGETYQFNFKYNGENYKANSLQSLYGRDDGLNFVGAFSGITELNENDLAKIIGFSKYVFYRKYQSKPLETTVKAESVGGDLDFKHKAYELLNINKQDLLLIDGIAYNANEAGNYLWGMVLEFNGLLISPNLIAEIGTSGRNDEAWEQRAISSGMKKSNEFGNKIDELTNEYLNEYFQKYGWGR